MWLMLQKEVAEDYDTATCTTTTVRDFVQMAFAEVGITLAFNGERIYEQGIVVACDQPESQLPFGQVFVAVEPAYFRLLERSIMVGDAIKARTILR